MKKAVIALCISSILLFAMIISNENKYYLHKTDKSPISTGSAWELTEPVYSDKDNREYEVIIDPTGEERRLYLGEINIKKQWGELEWSNPTTFYSQVEKDHYYYMRSDGSGNYTIFRDKGIKVSTFTLESGYIHDCLKCGAKCYVIWEGIVGDEDDEETRFAILDIKTGKRTFVPDIDCIDFFL